MQPSIKWGEPYLRLNGLNIRTGAEAITDIDFEKYPAFSMAQNQNAPAGVENYIMGVFQADNTFPLNTEIDDWSIAYTAVNNSELSLNNIGIFTGENADLSYITDNTELAPVAFMTGQRYHVIATNITGTPNLNDANQFKEPPYNNSREIWAPNAAANPSISDATTFYRGLNYNGYATQIYSFGIKSLFLEIRVIPTTISGDPLGNTDYSLKDYAALPEADRNNNPIGRAYARVYRRSNTNGTYSYISGDYSTILPVMAQPLKSDSYTSYVPYRLLKNDGDTNYLQLPLYGIAHTRTQGFVRWVNTGYGDYFFGADKVSGKRIVDLGGGEYNYYLYLDGTEENFEYLRKCCAQYGLFFCDSVDLGLNDHLYDSTYEANNGRWLHDKMHLGIIEDNGYAEGRYTSGIENGLQSQFLWIDSTESIYDPDVPPIPQNHYSDTTTFNSIGNLSTLTRRYALDGTAVENLGADLWTITEDLRTLDPDEDYKNFDQEVLNGFLTTNPINCVVSLRRFPLTLPYGSSDTIKLGKFDTNVSCYAMNKSAETYSFEGTFIAPQFGDSFLDYNPYTKFELYVPFCGTVELNPADILNRTLNVKLVVDFDTGTCTAYVLANNLCIETLNGSLAIDIPVTGTDATTVAAQIFNGIIQARQARQHGVFTNLSKAFTPSGLMSNIYNVFGSAEQIINAGNERKLAEYSISHTEAPVHVIGSASPVGSWAIDLNCRLIIYYPTSYMITYTPDNQAHWSESFINEYAQNTGFAVYQNGLVEYRRGLIIAANPLFSGVKTNSQNYPATQEELALIEQALQEGVISPGR